MNKKNPPAKDIALLVLALGVLVFCIFRQTGKKVIAEATAPTLVFTHWWENRDELLNTLKNEFEELHPEIKISLDYRSYGELWKAALAGEPGLPDAGAPDTGLVPDIIALDPLWIPESLARGTIETGPFPLLTFIHPLYYNIAILKNAGFSRPPKTRTEFLAQARAVTDAAAGRYALALALGRGNSRGVYRDLYSWIWASGIALKDLTTPEQGSRISPETRSLTEVLDFLSGMEKEGLLYREIASQGEDERRKAFLEGRTAFMIGSAEDMELLRQGLGEENVGYTAVPTPDSYSGKPVFGAGGWSLGIAGQSGHKNEARIFAGFLAEQSPRLAEGWAMPENGIYSYPRDLFFSKARELYISGDLAESGAALPGRVEEDKGGISQSRIRDAAFRDALLKLLAGETSPPEAARLIRQTAELIRQGLGSPGP